MLSQRDDREMSSRAAEIRSLSMISSHSSVTWMVFRALLARARCDENEIVFISFVEFPLARFRFFSTTSNVPRFTTWPSASRNRWTSSTENVWPKIEFADAMSSPPRPRSPQAFSRFAFRRHSAVPANLRQLRRHMERAARSHSR